MHDVVLVEREVWVADPVLDVLALAREEVVHDVDDVALHHERVDKVAADEARAASNEDALLRLRLRNGRVDLGSGAREALRLRHDRLLDLSVQLVFEVRERDALREGRVGEEGTALRVGESTARKM